MHDLRLAIRSLRSTPIVTAAAVISLTLGIGANTAIFSLFDSLVLKSLPIPDPGRLVRLSGVNAPEEGGPYSYAFYDEVRRHGDLFTGTAAYNCCGAATLTVGERSQTLTRMWVSGDFFSTLGVAAAVGRVIQPDDDRFGGGRDGIVAVITDRLWRERFDARSDTVGLPVTIVRPFNAYGPRQSARAVSAFCRGTFLASRWDAPSISRCLGMPNLPSCRPFRSARMSPSSRFSADCAPIARWLRRLRPWAPRNRRFAKRRSQGICHHPSG